MGRLGLDRGGVEGLFVEPGRGDMSEAVSDLSAFVAESAQGHDG